VKFNLTPGARELELWVLGSFHHDRPIDARGSCGIDGIRNLGRESRIPKMYDNSYNMIINFLKLTPITRIVCRRG
jgi:hypothetical protein